MVQRIDGWRLMARIVAQPESFHACDATVGLAAQLMVRNQLVQGVRSESALMHLGEVVGRPALLEVIDNLAGYEALRIAGNINPNMPFDRRSPDAARRWLAAIVETQPQPGALSMSEPESDPAPVIRIMRRHRAMGAQRRVGAEHG